jgi:uncharacterized protein YjiS (DUF1127 family)
MFRPYDEKANVATGSSGIGSFLDALDQRFVQPVLLWRHQRKTQRELMALDDRQLADIGLSRSDIDVAAFAPGRVPSHRA